MSGKNPVWAFQRAVLASRHLTATEKLVAIAMASTATFTTLEVVTGPAKLSELTGLSVRSVTRARASLEAANWIERRMTGGIVDGKRLTNVYTLNSGHCDRSHGGLGSQSQATQDTVSTNSGHSDLPTPFFPSNTHDPEKRRQLIDQTRRKLRVVDGATA